MMLTIYCIWPLSIGLNLESCKSWLWEKDLYTGGLFESDPRYHSEWSRGSEAEKGERSLRVLGWVGHWYEQLGLNPSWGHLRNWAGKGGRHQHVWELCTYAVGVLLGGGHGVEHQQGLAHHNRNCSCNGILPLMWGRKISTAAGEWKPRSRVTLRLW